LLKDASPDELVRAIRVAARGESLLQPTVAARVLDKLGEMMTTGETRPSKSTLTAREREVLRLLAGGARTRDVAETLFISERTVKSHIANVMQKLDANTRAEAVARAIQLGLLSGDET
jgi:DNA-binding NarL/FixJ family response regulator